MPELLPEIAAAESGAPAPAASATRVTALARPTTRTETTRAILPSNARGASAPHQSTVKFEPRVLLVRRSRSCSLTLPATASPWTPCQREGRWFESCTAPRRLAGHSRAHSRSGMLASATDVSVGPLGLSGEFPYGWGSSPPRRQAGSQSGGQAQSSCHVGGSGADLVSPPGPVPPGGGVRCGVNARRGVVGVQGASAISVAASERHLSMGNSSGDSEITLTATWSAPAR